MKTLYSLLIPPVLAISFMVDNQVAQPVNSPATPNIKQSAVNSFAFFRTHRQGRGVSASWGMMMSNGVSSFLLEKTYEDPNDPYAFWENVTSQACNGSRSYRFIDNNVFPGFITYRVTAFLQNGGTIVSEFSTEHIVSR